ncbi:hypothetical protein DFH06DRAFT_590279 [Mycena polygramma]|nr:hypothetical protein DFH06DRAFT_590279 [Mycena polygramma]
MGGNHLSLVPPFGAQQRLFLLSTAILATTWNFGLGARFVAASARLYQPISNPSPLFRWLFASRNIGHNFDSISTQWAALDVHVFPSKDDQLGLFQDSVTRHSRFPSSSDSLMQSWRISCLCLGPTGTTSPVY